MFYTASEHNTWREFYQSALENWEENSEIIHDGHLNNIKVLHSFCSRIPTLAELNEILKPISWQAKYVDGYTAPWLIAEMLSKNTLPISRSIRPKEKIYFADEPDLIHDVFGHFPILFNKEIRERIEAWSKVAVSSSIDVLDKASYYLNKAAVDRNRFDLDTYKLLEQTSKNVSKIIKPHPSRFGLLDRFYFWFFEFGILNLEGKSKVFGAGLLSSLEELNTIRAGKFSRQKINYNSLTKSYEISDQQTNYLFGDNFSEYDCVLKEIESCKDCL